MDAKKIAACRACEHYRDKDEFDPRAFCGNEDSSHYCLNIGDAMYMCKKLRELRD